MRKTIKFRGQILEIIKDYGDMYLCIDEFSFGLKRIPKLVRVK